MRRSRLWHDAPPSEHEDQFQEVALVLCGRDFKSETHLRRALWMGLGFRAKDFWKAARRREVSVGEFFEPVARDPSGDGVEEEAALAADSRIVDDCLSELDDRERLARTRFALVERPDYLVRELGPYPHRRSKRRIWRQAAHRVETYREDFGVKDTERALGTQPVDLRQRAAWRDAQRAVDDARCAMSREPSRARERARYLG
jgi:hypothetical protein